jgi:hypothetical protein
MICGKQTVAHLTIRAIPQTCGLLFCSSLALDFPAGAKKQLDVETFTKKLFQSKPSFTI